MDVESVLARRILQLANQILRNRNEDLKELEITAEQADALRFFQGHPGCSAVDLKAHLGITHQAARAIVCAAMPTSMRRMGLSASSAGRQITT